jgi:hypothetical protein
LFQLPTSRLLEAVRAQERDEYTRCEYGLVPVRAVAYQDDRVPRQVIERMWRGYQIQPTLLNWLYELLVAASEPVRYFAANTLGVLSCYAFDYVWAKALSRWANSKDLRLREAVAYALEVPAAEPELTAAVTAIVGGWYADLDSPLRQATAARAFGLCIGVPDAATAIDRLGRLATIDDYNIAVAIGDALADLIANDPERMAPRVCRALVDWFDDKTRTRAAQLAFLVLASSLVTWERPDGSGLAVPWPTLLRLAEPVAELRDPLAVLWHRLYTNSVLFNQANAVLTGWAGHAEADPEQLAALVRLIRAVLRQPESDHRIHRNLSRLATDWVAPLNLNPLPRCRQAVVNLLDKVGRGGV